MITSDFLPFAELVPRIAALSAERYTGAVLLVSDDNRMGQLHLLAGQIVHVLCRGRRGSDALVLMRTMRRARLSLDRATPGPGAGPGMPTA
jgi:pentatricopeptide repeat protein